MSALTKPESPALSRFFGEHPLQNIRQQMEDTIQSVLGDTSILHSSSGMRPRMDVSETDAEIEVQTDLPGFKPEEVNIQINDNYLMISGSHSEEQKREDQNRQYHCLERRSGSIPAVGAAAVPRQAGRRRRGTEGRGADGDSSKVAKRPSAEDSGERVSRSLSGNADLLYSG